MFTGIIESFGTVEEITKEGLNKTFKISSAVANELKVDQSVCHDGVCLTVIKTDGNFYWTTAIDETLGRTTLGSLTKGRRVNLERCMVANGRFDGHIVQGHVDQTATIRSIKQVDGSTLIDIEYDSSTGNVTVEKGSITVNGVSLTCFNSTKNSFTVAIIPYTSEHTNIGQLKHGDVVNLEFDIIGKYVKRLLGML